MKETKEKKLRTLIQKFLKENYLDDSLGMFDGEFDELDFENSDASEAARADIEASGEEFEELGSSKFEKRQGFKDDFKNDLKKANLQLPSDEEEIETLAKIVNDKNKHEKIFGKGSLNENSNTTDSEGNEIKLKSRIEHKQTNTIGFVERMAILDNNVLGVQVNWLQKPGQEKLPKTVAIKDILVKDKKQTPQDSIEENGSRSLANGHGENLKPANFPEELQENFLDNIKAKIKNVSPDQTQYNKENNLPLDWKGTKEGYHEFITNKQHSKNTNEGEEYVDYTMGNENDPNQLPINENDSDNWNEEIKGLRFLDYNGMEIMDAEGAFFVDDEEFNSLEDAKKYVDEYSGPSEEKINLYRHGMMENENNYDRYERIVTLQDHEADHALNILKHDGVDDALDYLMQWDNGGSGETSDEAGFGSSDKTYERDGYILSWNAPLGYISLTHDSKANIEEDSQIKRHLSNQREKSRKGIPLGKHNPHSNN